MSRSSVTRRDAMKGAAGALAGAWALGRVPPLGGASPLAVATAEAAGPVTPGLTDADYWTFIDGLLALVHDSWVDDQDLYGVGDTAFNSYLLYVHATAALAGHRGLARQDARARRLAARLCRHWPWFPGPNDPPPGTAARIARDQTHHHGWSPSMHGPSTMHVVIDTTVVRGLAQAWAAREALGLSPETRGLVRQRILLCANDGFYAYPALRLNQISWPIEIYAHAATVSGDPKLLRRDAGNQFRRFAAGIARPMPGMHSPNLGPGYRFHYLPQSSERTRSNLDSAEYALIVVQALRFYEQGLRAGMPALPTIYLRRLRAWVERALCGYWTHGGYLNWDTGLGFDRWHQGKKHGLAQLGILAIALSPRFHNEPEYARYAKYFFDRGVYRYGAFVNDGGGRIPAAVAYGVTKTGALPTDDELWLARMACNAAIAIHHGLGAKPSQEPPPLYAFDPDIGRLAITTPRYSTAVVPVNHKAFPWGGVELSRLFDGDNRVAANIGGRVPAAFGVTVESRARGRTLNTQRADDYADPDRPRLRLTRAPRGTGRRLAAYPRRPYAGAFRALDAEGWTRSTFAAVRTRHRFRASYVETAWTVIPRRAARGAHTVRAHFPSWGRDEAEIAVHLRGGGVADGAGVDLRDIAWVHLRSLDSGYVLVPQGPLPRGTTRLLRPSVQSSAPLPGPTLVFELLAGGRLRRLELTVRVAPVRRDEDAEKTAARLGS